MKSTIKTSTLDRDAWELYRTLSQLVRVFEFRDRMRICCHEVSVTQCRALGTLIRQGPLTLNELSSHLYLDKSTVSRVIDSLQRKGHVRRMENPKDARSLILNVTKEGHQLHTLIEQELVNGVKKLIEGLDPDVRQATTSLLSRLAREAETLFPRMKKNYDRDR